MKIVVKNEKEFIQIFENEHWSWVEKFLDIEFAYVDGKFQSDIYVNGVLDESIDENQDIDTNIYRKYKNLVYDERITFPESYPCLVIFLHEKGYDRTGPIEMQFLEFVYPSDFDEQ